MELDKDKHIDSINKKAQFTCNYYTTTNTFMTGLILLLAMAIMGYIIDFISQHYSGQDFICSFIIIVLVFLGLALLFFVGLKNLERARITGMVQLYNDYAVLSFKNETLMLKKNAFSIRNSVSTSKGRAFTNTVWKIYIGRRTICFRALRGVEGTSLDNAMMQIVDSGLPKHYSPGL